MAVATRQEQDVEERHSFRTILELLYTKLKQIQLAIKVLEGKVDEQDIYGELEPETESDPSPSIKETAHIMIDILIDHLDNGLAMVEIKKQAKAKGFNVVDHQFAACVSSARAHWCSLFQRVGERGWGIFKLSPAGIENYKGRHKDTNGG